MSEDYLNVKLPTDDTITVAEIRQLEKNVLKFLEDQGNPGINIMWLCNLILKRLHKDRDYMINIEGVKGTGKSNFILLLALLQCRYAGLWRNKKTGKVFRVQPRAKPLDETEWEQLTVDFKFKENMSFLDEADAVRTKFNSITRYAPFIIDEGSKNLHKYEWNNKLQFLLVRMSDTERYQNKAIYVCFPNFKELNSAFRNDRVMMRVYLFDRNKAAGYSSAVISIKDVNRYVSDPWHTDDNAKKFEELLKRVPAAMRGPSHILYAEKKLAGYAGNFNIPSLELIAPRIWNIYLKYKIYYAQKDQNIVEGEDGKENSKRVLQWQLYLRNLIDFVTKNNESIDHKEIAKIIGTSPVKVKNLLRTTSEQAEKIQNKNKPISVNSPDKN